MPHPRPGLSSPNRLCGASRLCDLWARERMSLDAPRPGSIRHSGQLAAQSIRHSENHWPAHVSLPPGSLPGPGLALEALFSPQTEGSSGTPGRRVPMLRKEERDDSPSEPYAINSHQLPLGTRQEGQVWWPHPGDWPRTPPGQGPHPPVGSHPGPREHLTTGRPEAPFP